MSFGWTLLKLAALWEGTHMALEYHERHHYFNLSKQYCTQVGKPLLRVGMHRGMFEPPNGDYTIDIDPVIKQVPGGVWADERDMPFEDKQFGVCCHPESPVLVKNGFHVPISTIKVGDKVVTHLGRLKRVTNIHVRDYEGELIRVKPHYFNEFALTPEHPVMIKRTVKSYAKRDWLQIGNLKQDDYIVGAVERREDVNRVIKIRGYDSIPLDSETAWLFGYWIGDGWITQANDFICFSVSKDEDELKVKDIMKRVFGIEPISGRVTPKEKTLRFQSSKASKWFVAFMGDVKALTKNIPSALFYAPKEIRASLLMGLLASDGHNGNHFTTSSALLADQFTSLLLRLGYLPCTSIVTVEQMNSYNSFHANGDSYRISWGRKFSKFGTPTRLTAKVDRISRQYYKGPVYNLEVKDDNTYVVGHVVVHNCFNEHTLEHQYNVNDVELAVNECVRVADIAVFLAPSPWRIVTTLFAPTHFLRLWFDPHTNTIKVVPNEFRPSWMPADYDMEHQKQYSQVLVSNGIAPKILDRNSKPSFSRIGNGFILANPEYAEIRGI